MTRIFIGITVPDDIAAKAMEIERKVSAIKGLYSFVRKENLHFTVLFLGEKSEQEIQKIREALDSISSKTKKFSVDAQGVGAFPGESYIRVIWIGVKQPQEFNRLIFEVKNKLGAKSEKKEEPHMTIARVKSVLEKQKMNGLIAENRETHFGSMTAEKITLFKSELTPDGPVYSVISEHKLI